MKRLRWPNLLTSLRVYSHFVYTLPDQYSSIHHSTLVLAPFGSLVASLAGKIYFAQNIVLRVVEELDFLAQRIDYYSYSVTRKGERLYWYDPQPHPHIPSLQSTHPHHKHVPPDIKHNRAPRGTRCTWDQFYRTQLAFFDSRDRTESFTKSIVTLPSLSSNGFIAAATASSTRQATYCVTSLSIP